MKIKKQLLEQCRLYLKKREKTVNDIMISNKKALLLETKSSAGDKHETGRAMLQLEMEKASQQILVNQQMKRILDQIYSDCSSDKVRLGSLVYTNKETYFLSISVGVIYLNKESFFVISSASPIGKLLMGKQKNDTIQFNGDQITITGVN